MRYLWYTVLDVVTSPVAWAAFGAGMMFSGLCLLAVVRWFVPWYERTAQLSPTSAGAVVDDEWESPCIHNRWLNVTHRSSLSPYVFHVVNEDTQNTVSVQLTEPVARSLSNWLNQHLKGVQP